MVDYIKMFSQDESITKYFCYIIQRLAEVRNDCSREWSLESLKNTEFQKLEYDIEFHLNKVLSYGLNSSDLDIITRNLNSIISILDSCYVDNTNK